MYRREIPRDLFNEAKLLKCLGQLALFIHDGVDSDRKAVPESLKLVHDTDGYDGFEVDQESGSGDLFCRNVNLFIGDKVVDLTVGLNSRLAYPLAFTYASGNPDYVFYDDGSLSDVFLEFVKHHS